MNGIHNDSMSHICEFLPIVNILELRRISSMFIKIPVIRIFKQRLIKQIMRICDVDKADATSLIARCDTRGGVISGSIILQVLIGEEWESDMDIFVNTRPKMFSKKDFVVSVLGLPHNIVFEEYISSFYTQEQVGNDEEKKSYPTVNTQNLDLPVWGAKSDYCLLYNYSRQTADNSSKYNKIQVIGMDRDLSFSHHRAAVEHFDLSIVSNSFFKNTLEVWNLDMIVSRKVTMFKLPHYGRMDKYRQRGFSCTTNISVWNTANESVWYTLNNRLCKSRVKELCKIPVTPGEIYVVNQNKNNQQVTV